MTDDELRECYRYQVTDILAQQAAHYRARLGGPVPSRLIVFDGAERAELTRKLALLEAELATRDRT